MHRTREAGRTFAVSYVSYYVNHNLLRDHRWWRVVVLTLAVLLAAGSRGLRAHDLFTAYIQHAIRLAVNAQQLDLTLDLTFFEEWSAKERLAMDTDGNGRISRSEKDAYVKKLAPRIAQQVKLRVGGREAAIAPLYDPELDLLGSDQVGPAHHRLRLFFFVVTPVQIRAGDEIVVTDSLWPKAKALGTQQVENGDGSAFEVKPTGEPIDAIAQTDNAKRFTFRCVKPPAALIHARQTAQ